MTYKPPQADSPGSQDHVCTLQSCHGAGVAPLSDVPQEGSSVFSLFSLIKLHLASLPLASSYSRVAVSSVFWAQNIYFSAQTRGAPLNVPSFSFQIAEFLDPKIRNPSGHCKRDGLPKISRRAELQVRTQQLCPMKDCKLAQGS